MFPLAISLAASAADLPDVDTALKTGAKSDKDAAVVIGIEDYLKIPDVPYAQRDAKAMYDFLVYTRGIPASRIRLLDQGASREQIADALDSTGTSVSSGGTVWVYFAGHGAADPSTGERMLLGDDVRGDPAAFAARGIGLSEVKKLAQKGGGTVNLIVDACYSGVGRSGEELVAGKRFAVPVRTAAPVASVLEWNAASADQMSGPLDAAKHGAFTYFVLGAMRGWADGQIDGKPDGKVTAEEANLYVTDALRAVQITSQKPEMAIASPKDRILSSGAALEKAPALTAPSSNAVPVPKAAAAGAVDAADHAQTLAWLESKYTSCYDRLAAGHPQPELRRMYVRLRVKKGPKAALVYNNADITMESPLAQTLYAIGLCVQNEAKATRWVNPAKDVVFQDTLAVPTRPGEVIAGPTDPTVLQGAVVKPEGGAVTPSPNGAAQVAAQRVTLVFKSKDGTWLDLKVDGDPVELRGLGQPRFAVTPGKHTIEVYAFMGKDVLSRATIDTGVQPELSIGLDGAGKVECYNCAGN
jgi:hypothetical protein